MYILWVTNCDDLCVPGGTISRAAAESTRGLCLLQTRCRLCKYGADLTTDLQPDGQVGWPSIRPAGKQIN